MPRWPTRARPEAGDHAGRASEITPRGESHRPGVGEVVELDLGTPHIATVVVPAPAARPEASLIEGQSLETPATG